jgi:hypothetical protein
MFLYKTKTKAKNMIIVFAALTFSNMVSLDRLLALGRLFSAVILTTLFTKSTNVGNILSSTTADLHVATSCQAAGGLGAAGGARCPTAHSDRHGQRVAGGVGRRESAVW